MRRYRLFAALLALMLATSACSSPPASVEDISEETAPSYTQEDMDAMQAEKDALQAEIDRMTEENETLRAELAAASENEEVPAEDEAEDTAAGEVSEAPAEVTQTAAAPVTSEAAPAAPSSTAPTPPASSTTPSSSAAATNGTGVFAGYNVTVLDKTTPAVTSGSDLSLNKYFFYSSSGAKVGEMNEADASKIMRECFLNGTAPSESKERTIWFAEQFNIYRGLTSGSASSAVDFLDADTSAREVVRLINIERKNLGLMELEIDEDMMAYAQQRAREIADDFSHEYGVYGENINRGCTSAKSVVKSWMESSSHRDNLLLEQWNYTGVGCYKAGNGKIHWVQIFSK